MYPVINFYITQESKKTFLLLISWFWIQVIVMTVRSVCVCVPEKRSFFFCQLARIVLNNGLTLLCV